MAMQKIKKGGFVSDELQKINANFNEVEQQYAKKTEIPTAPTKVSELANDANYQNGTQVAASIQSAIAATGHAKFVKVDTIPTAATAAENVLYLVMNATTGHYDIYAKVSGEVLLIDDTTVNLTGYSSTAQMNAAIAAAVAGCVAKENGKVLSSNDFTNEYKAKLDSLSAPEIKNFTADNFTASDDEYICTIAANGKKPGLVMRKNGTTYGVALVDITVSGANIVITSDEAFEGYIICV